MQIFIKGGNIHLNLFLDAMAAGCEDGVFLDYSNNDSFTRELIRLDPEIDHSTRVICFNNIGVSAILPGHDMFYWAEKDVEVVDILVDHPLYYFESFSIALYIKRLKFYCVDRHQAGSIAESFPILKGRIGFLPHGGLSEEDVDVIKGLGEKTYRGKAEKNIDVLYLGTGHRMDVNHPATGIPGIDDKEFYDMAFESLISDPYMQEDIAVGRYEKEKGLTLNAAERMTLTAVLLKTVHYTALHHLKEQMIEALADEGIRLEIHGEGWEDIAGKHRNNVTLGEYLDPVCCPALMERAKIVLNFHPFFSEGSHERVFGAMRCGCVCVSSKSRYLESRFEDGKDIIYYDIRDPKASAKRIKELLTNEVLLKEIAENGKMKTENDSWAERLRSL
ncbi:MAG: glycosyltransferase [Lachnospiraceae bacterium]|nr:glycosyltransferase [Lachnospiraceae bacterium]